MPWLTIFWDSPRKEELALTIPASIEAGENEDEFTLQVDKCAILDCEMEELRELILYLVATHKFDVADLSNLSATAILYRNKKAGMTNITIDPPPFRRLRPIRRAAPSSKTVRKNVHSNNGAISAAAAFALILFIGALLIVARRKYN